jgi:RNA-directed DNA polymerase
VDDLKQACGAWSAATLCAGHTPGDRPPPGRRTYSSQPDKQAVRPLGGPCLGDRVLQRRVAAVLTAIAEPALLPCSFGGRPGVGAHHALATIHAVMAGKPGSGVYVATLRNFWSKPRRSPRPTRPLGL